MRDDELAEEIKKRMFVFEDIVKLTIVQCNDSYVVDNNDLTLALKSTSEGLQMLYSLTCPNDFKK